MRQRFMGTLLALVCSLAATVAPTPARAEVGSTYASESFKKLARKLAKNWAAGALSKACPGDKPLCAMLIAGVVEAFEAIQGGEIATAEQALQAAFVESTVVGGASLALPRLADIDASLPPAEKTSARELLTELLRCASRIVIDRRTAGCTLGADLVAKLKQVLGDQVLGNDKLHVERFIDDVSKGKRPTTETTLHVLAAVASSKAIKRDDYRVYILNLEHAVAGGLEGGLYPFVQRFLTAPNPQVDDIRAGGANIILATDAELAVQRAEVDKLMDSARACGAGATVDTWNNGRQKLREQLRKELLLGQRISNDSLAKVDALIAMRCTTAGADTSGVEALVRYGQYLRAALTMHNLDQRYGAVLLAIAALIDQVRTPDDDLFVARVKAIASRLVTQYQGAMCTYVRSNRKADPDTCVSVAAAQKPLCEVALVRALARGDDPLTMGECYPVIQANVLAPGANVDTVLCKTFQAGPLLDGVRPAGGGKCTIPTRDTMNGAAVVDHLLGKLDDLAGPIDVAGAGTLTYRLDEPERKLVQASVRVMRLLLDGDRRGAGKVIARLAVDEMMTRLLGVVKEQVTNTDKCGAESRETSVLFGDNRLCAVYLLIEAAYVPIADQIWDGGVNEKTASSIAKATYKRMLESELLAGAPIILNVGLGANVIWGDAWEDMDGDPFGALTVVDKFGLVFYRRRGPSFTFETGPFVGGFVDAIIRTAADQEHRSWLLGYTVGWTRMWGYDVGVQAHGGVAMPFAFDNFTDEVGYAVGGSLVVPWSDYLEED